jgi:hypothetical protein
VDSAQATQSFSLPPQPYDHTGGELLIKKSHDQRPRCESADDRAQRVRWGFPHFNITGNINVTITGLTFPREIFPAAFQRGHAHMTDSPSPATAAAFTTTVTNDHQSTISGNSP